MIILRLIAVLLVLSLSVTFSFGNPFLTASPLEHTDYYVVSIDGNEVSHEPALNDDLFLDLVDLPDGNHLMQIIPGDWDNGEGGVVTFNLIKDTNPQWIHYTIRKTPKENPNDPWYDDRFDEPIKIKVPNDEYNNPPKEDWISGGGGGSGCS